MSVNKQSARNSKKSIHCHSAPCQTNADRVSASQTDVCSWQSNVYRCLSMSTDVYQCLPLSFNVYRYLSHVCKCLPKYNHMSADVLLCLSMSVSVYRTDICWSLSDDALRCLPMSEAVRRCLPYPRDPTDACQYLPKSVLLGSIQKITF